MAVSALELRPRGAVAILDAALRLCSRNTGVWALTLPGGALVTLAVLHLADTVTHHQSLVLPTLWSPSHGSHAASSRAPPAITSRS